MAKSATAPAKTKPAPQPKAVRQLVFNIGNYTVLLVGLALLILGFILMSGGQQPPDKFDPNELYSFRRITLSTIFVIGGFVVILFSIFWKRNDRRPV